MLPPPAPSTSSQCETSGRSAEPEPTSQQSTVTVEPEERVIHEFLVEISAPTPLQDDIKAMPLFMDALTRTAAVHYDYKTRLMDIESMRKNQHH